MSECYLIHLFAPVNPDRPARHYLGFAANTVEREANYRKHRQYYHSRLMFAAVERGIDFVVCRVWKNADKRDEKLLRDLHDNPRLCPICNHRLDLTTRLNASGRYQTYPTADPKRIRYGDLNQLRDRQLRPTRRRIRSDGTDNLPPVDPLEVLAADYAATGLSVERVYERGILIEVTVDPNFAAYGFDADIAF